MELRRLVRSLGASFCGGHLVVPSPNLDPDLQPRGRLALLEARGAAPERHIFAFWFGSVDKAGLPGAGQIRGARCGGSAWCSR